jgi:hypothetical protein
LQSLFLFPGRQLLDVDFGSFGRGHALQRIDLYPVRAQAPSSHNQYSRMPSPENTGGEPNYYWAASSHQSSRSPAVSPLARQAL